MVVVNWTHEETFKLISLWSEDVIQAQLEGCRRNSQVYQKIAGGLREAGFSCTMEQCRDKIKKLKSEHKKLEIRGRPQDKGDIPSGNFSMHWTKFLVQNTQQSLQLLLKVFMILRVY